MSHDQRDSKYNYTQNRELSWLRFNERVLQEAEDHSNPPLERLKFVSIFSSNLDEFFMVRVGSLFDLSQISPEEMDSKTGMTSEGQLKKIYQTIPSLIALKKQIYEAVENDLKKYGIEDLSYDELSAKERKFLTRYFKDSILPLLSPMIIGSHHPLPNLMNKCLYIAVHLEDKKGKQFVGFVPVPVELPSYIALPDTQLRFMRIENIVEHWADALFGSYKVIESCVLCVTRNADISFDEEKFEDNEKDLRNKVMKLLKKRERLSVMRMELSKKVSASFLEHILKLISVDKHKIFVDTCPLLMDYVFSLPDELSSSQRKKLLYKNYEPRWPEDISPDYGMIEQIQKSDKLVFYPFDSVQPFLNLLSEAAENPDVLSIKITIYQLASSSKIARILCRAAENGKEVIVLMELRARFDEENNVTWARILEDAGGNILSFRSGGFLTSALVDF